MTSIALTVEQWARVRAVLPLLRSTSAIVAGGYVRDALNGDTPADIDIFTSPADAPKVRANVEAEEAGAWVAVSRAIDPDADASASGGAAGLRDVEQLGRVQVITVDDPVARVRVFDAHCNMLWVSADGAVRAESPYAYNHALARVWEPHPDAVTTPDEAAGRRARFEAKGYGTVHDTDAAALADDIDELFAMPGA